MSAYPTRPLDTVLSRAQQSVVINPQQTYKQVTVRLFHKGVVLRGQKLGSDIRTSRQWLVHQGQVLLSRIDARHGAIGTVPPELEEAIVTSDFWAFNMNVQFAEPAFLDAYFGTPAFVDACNVASEGTTNRVRLQPGRFLNIQVPLPPLDEQRRIVSRIEQLAAKVEVALRLRQTVAAEVELLRQSGTDRFFSHINSARLARIEETCEVRGGIQKCSRRSPGANPRRYITVAHVQRNSIDTGDPRYFEVSDKELERWRLLSGDVLVIEGNGSSEQIGRAALFRGEIEDCVHQNHVIRVRPNPNILIPEYLNTYFNSPIGRGQMLERSRTTSGLFNLSVGRINEIEIPLPSLEEQRRLIREVSFFESTISALKKPQSEVAAELDALMPSILSKAFRGEL